jgi:cytochrome P450
MHAWMRRAGLALSVLSVSPLLAPDHVAAMEATIRAHAAEIPDGLPVAEEFDWADRKFKRPQEAQQG